MKNLTVDSQSNKMRLATHSHTDDRAARLAEMLLKSHLKKKQRRPACPAPDWLPSLNHACCCCMWASSITEAKLSGNSRQPGFCHRRAAAVTHVKMEQNRVRNPNNAFSPTRLAMLPHSHYAMPSSPTKPQIDRPTTIDYPIIVQHLF